MKVRMKLEAENPAPCPTRSQHSNVSKVRVNALVIMPILDEK